jgi:hypothetical protein
MENCIFPRRVSLRRFFRFNMKDVQPVSTPLATKFKLSSRLIESEDQKEKSYMYRVPYSSAVGSIMYLMVCTRPDIAHAVSMVSRSLFIVSR